MGFILGVVSPIIPIGICETVAQFACEDVNCAVAIGRGTMPQTIDDDERIRTVSVSWPVHPALDEIIQELEDKLELKPDPPGLLTCQVSCLPY